ncbi:UAA transporter [Piptocephalis cylindrospora]|uniref:UAA transporter n=1 Tax=Piptocephalis cylindrospora TaxID=1907219 RepID=A0A4P9YAK7_9FUNG|nr:UAA transporter [Piptocephalis cylindrospora]|eukprot:RKP15120.1 UAA transporter [Piptocephalis cylindrospora]
MPKKNTLSNTSQGGLGILGIWFPVLSLIFGGCCANVLALEAMVSEAPHSANLFTAAQFLIVALLNLPAHTHWPKGSWFPRLAPRKVPMTRWIGQVALHLSISLLNNVALGYQIPIPLHIVFRSAGLLVSMLLGALVAKKRYATMQIVSVLAVSAGVILSTLSSSSSTSSKGQSKEESYSQYLIGISLLSVALLLSGFLGLYQEKTYAKYGNQWREGLFYGHFLALPFFFIFFRDIQEQSAIYNASQPMQLTHLARGTPFASLSPLIPSMAFPRLWIQLGVNLVTQYICVLGVNRLTGIASALTLNLVLNVRKLTSLVLSVFLFGNTLGPGGWAGCLLVAAGSMMYALSSRTQSPPSSISPTGPPGEKKKVQ